MLSLSQLSISPYYIMPKRDPLITHKIMSRIRSKNTKAEVILGKSLWNLGLRYRKNYKDLIGKPDFVFLSNKIAVFCDGDFWHGRDFKERLEKRGFKTNPEYWIKKISGNMKRDKEINKILKKNGWLVLRYWANDILKDPASICDEIYSIVKK